MFFFFFWNDWLCIIPYEHVTSRASSSLTVINCFFFFFFCQLQASRFDENTSVSVRVIPFPLFLIMWGCSCWPCIETRPCAAFKNSIQFEALLARVPCFPLRFMPGIEVNAQTCILECGEVCLCCFIIQLDCFLTIVMNYRIELWTLMAMKI